MSKTSLGALLFAAGWLGGIALGIVLWAHVHPLGIAITIVLVAIWLLSWVPRAPEVREEDGSTNGTP